MKNLSSNDIEMMLPYEMYRALIDRYHYQIETDDIDDIGFDKYLDYFFKSPFDLLSAYLEWEGILGYSRIIKEFILRFHQFLKEDSRG